MASYRGASARASPTSSLLAGGSSGSGSGSGSIAFQLLGPAAGAGAGTGEEGAAAARWVLGRKYDDGALIYEYMNNRLLGVLPPHPAEAVPHLFIRMLRAALTLSPSSNANRGPGRVDAALPLPALVHLPAGLPGYGALPLHG